jgi:NAD+ synthase
MSTVVHVQKHQTISLASIALIQCNPIVGDIAGNISRIKAAYDASVMKGATLVVFPECAVIGYSAEDLLLRPDFQTAAMDAVRELAHYTQDHPAAMLIGSLWVQNETMTNAAILLEHGAVQHIIHKHELPNEGVFDEERFFAAGGLPEIVEWRGHRLGVMVCADMWHGRVARHLAVQGAELFIVINASPFELGKDAKRKALAHGITTTYHTPLIYLNLVGGQDEVVFDGGSFCMNAAGEVVQQLPCFEEVNVCYAPQNTQNISTLPSDHALTYAAMMMGLRDYVLKNGFSDVIIGLSGGIDSAITAIVAVDALGAEHVRTVMLPSPYTTKISLHDAQELASALGVCYDIIPIESGMQAVDGMLAAYPLTPLAKENIQSRLRGVLLMALSNSTGALLLTTGNKSEMATGYATLYGDMCGAFSVLKDVYKTDVFALARWRNTHHPRGARGGKGAMIPERIITRPPSAELRENQRDDDSLPPYDVLDGILHLLIDQRASCDDIIAEGYAAETVQKVVRLVKLSEYKRRQAPIGVKLSSMAFGRDWRMPLTNGFVS